MSRWSSPWRRGCCDCIHFAPSLPSSSVRRCTGPKDTLKVECCTHSTAGLHRRQSARDFSSRCGRPLRRSHRDEKSLALCRLCKPAVECVQHSTLRVSFGPVQRRTELEGSEGAK